MLSPLATKVSIVELPRLLAETDRDTDKNLRRWPGVVFVETPWYSTSKLSARFVDAEELEVLGSLLFGGWGGHGQHSRAGYQ